MIDRSTFRSVMALVAIMLAAAAWRVSQLADWTRLPRYNFSGVAITPIHSAILLLIPGMVVLNMTMLASVSRLASKPEGLPPWRIWAARFLVPTSLLMVLIQALIITRSLGLFLTMNPLLVARTCLVGTGLVCMTAMNVVPKLPSLGSRVRLFDVDPDQGRRMRRFVSWLGVLQGLILVLGGIFLPILLMMRITVILSASMIAAVLLFLFTAKRGQPQ